MYHAKLVKIWSILTFFVLIWAKFDQFREISWEIAHFPSGNFPVAIPRFPISRREMCISNHNRLQLSLLSITKALSYSKSSEVANDLKTTYSLQQSNKYMY